MAEAFAALGAVAGALQLVEFTAKVLKCAHQLSTSSTDALREDIELTRLTKEHEALVTRLHRSTSSQPLLSRNEQSVVTFSEERQKQAMGLLDLLGELKVTSGCYGVKRAFRSATVAKRRILKQKEIKKRCKSLQSVNGQLETALLVIQGDQSDKLIDQSFSILGAIKASEERIEAVLSQKQQCPRRVQLRLQALNSLQFPEMSSRHHSIANAFSETFDWALEHDTNGLITWLLRGSDLYWICGKAGSGKSTFMKFLCGDERTLELLRTWAGGAANLILVKCYFWYLGTELEKSIDGLLRTILHQILEAHELVSEPMEICLDRQGTGLWTEAALRELIQMAILNAAPRKVCIFIDGLDEYKGNHTTLVTFLNELASQSGAKLCVSSRPWNVFTRAYEENKPHLYLQDLTRPDIEHYVTSTLTSAATAATADDPDMTAEALLDITHDVIRKADGVFLWVALVTQSVLTGLAEGDHILTLRQRVLEFPTDLGAFFKCILDRIEPVYRNQTVQCLLLACLYLDGHNAKAAAMSSFLDFWFIRQAPTGLENLDYFYQLVPRPVSFKEFITMESQTRRFLSSCCKDPLHVLPRQGQHSKAYGAPGSSQSTFMGMLPKNGNSQRIKPGPGPKVQFLHRTVYDFIQETGERMSLEQKAPSSFTNGDVLHMINLGRLKLYPKCGTQYYPKRGTCARHGRESCMVCDEITDTDDRLAFDQALHDGASFSLRSSWPGLGKEFVEQLRIVHLLRQHGSEFSSVKVPLAGHEDQAGS